MRFPSVAHNGSVDWDNYEPYDPGTFGPLHEQTRADAKTAFDKLMCQKEERKNALTDLLRANGVKLDSSNEGIQKLNDWFRLSVEQEPDGEPGRLRPMWYSVVNDIALFLGDAILERAPNLRWEFFIWGKRNVSYQHHVLMGFPTRDPKYNVDVDLCVATYGHRAIVGEDNRSDYFVYFVEGAVSLAKIGQAAL
jgi:hypothetical protein